MGNIMVIDGDCCVKNLWLHKGGYIDKRLLEFDIDLIVDRGYYQRLHELLKVYKIGNPFLRLGRDNDGGYVMPQIFTGSGIVYSFGI